MSFSATQPNKLLEEFAKTTPSVTLTLALILLLHFGLVWFGLVAPCFVCFARASALL